MQPNKFDLRHQLKGTLIVLAWLTLALVCRESGRDDRVPGPEAPALTQAEDDPNAPSRDGPR